MPEQFCIKLCMCLTAPEPFSAAYFINLSRQSVCFYANSLIVVRQRLGRNVTATTNTHADPWNFTVLFAKKKKKLFSKLTWFLLRKIIFLAILKYTPSVAVINIDFE
jgi:hypothetical protein